SVIRSQARGPEFDDTMADNIEKMAVSFTERKNIEAETAFGKSMGEFVGLLAYILNGEHGTLIAPENKDIEKFFNENKPPFGYSMTYKQIAQAVFRTLHREDLIREEQIFNRDQFLVDFQKNVVAVSQGRMSREAFDAYIRHQAELIGDVGVI